MFGDVWEISDLFNYDDEVLRMLEFYAKKEEEGEKKVARDSDM